MKIAIFYEHREIGASGFYAERALGELGHRVDRFKKSDRARARDYDLYFRMEDGEYGYTFSKDQNPVIYWTMDTHLSFSRKRIFKEAPEYDFLFACHQSGERALRQAGYRVSWLPVGCDPKMHGRVEVPLAYAVSSIGKEEGIPRKFLLQEIRERYSPTFIKKADFRLMQKVYSASKIGFNQAINRDLNMRCFEVMCSGALLVTSEIEDDSYEKLGFKDGQNFVVFKNPRDLFQKLDYYLTHDQERNAIAESGRRLVSEKHTYRHRMETLLGALKEEGLLRNISPSQPSAAESISSQNIT